MLQTFYEVSIYHNDYFDHFRGGSDKPSVTRFTNLVEAFKAYKESKSKDYYWPGDHERETFFNKVIEFVKPAQPKHGLIIGHKPTVDHYFPYCEEGDLDYLDRLTEDDEDVRDLPLDRSFVEEKPDYFDDDDIEF